MNSSAEQGTFRRQCKIDEAIKEGLDPETDESVQHALKIEQMIRDRKAEAEADLKWRENNLEYDLRSTKWICDKAKANENYAQNIYAALCNQDWQKNNVWPILKDQRYSCSWRYAGGIVADMLEKGDYIDWYCSGISGGDEPDVYRNASLPGSFVSEGNVTDEIREDFIKLGWIPVDDNET